MGFWLFSFDDEREFWVTDGTTEGTNLLLSLERNSSGSYVEFIPFGQIMIIVSETDHYEYGVWASDGTIEGTVFLRTFFSDTGAFRGPENFTIYDDKLYFSSSNGYSGEELYVTDGTVEGTRQVADINQTPLGSQPADFKVRKRMN